MEVETPPQKFGGFGTFWVGEELQKNLMKVHLENLLKVHQRRTLEVEKETCGGGDSTPKIWWIWDLLGGWRTFGEPHEGPPGEPSEGPPGELWTFRNKLMEVETPPTKCGGFGTFWVGGEPLENLMNVHQRRTLELQKETYGGGDSTPKIWWIWDLLGGWRTFGEPSEGPPGEPSEGPPKENFGGGVRNLWRWRLHPKNLVDLGPSGWVENLWRTF
nr:uncharacterized protein LOC121468957 [Taeniopygia guttata]